MIMLFSMLTAKNSDCPNPIRTYLLKTTLLLIAGVVVFSGRLETVAYSAQREGRPNIVIIYIDDMGYNDIGPFGAKGYATPNLDRMAAEGMKFTSFYSAQAVCSASRAAP